MIGRKMQALKAMHLTVGGGAFLPDLTEPDVAEVAAKTPGIYVSIYCAIPLDAISRGRCEIYRTKTGEASSIDFYQSSWKKTNRVARKESPGERKTEVDHG
ncbi:MAG TPA: hypothetical protein DCR97_11105 [Deltaproteobacteria bacterium]|nr:hypothetical protein [Deltaproteobacteria bacterium]